MGHPALAVPFGGFGLTSELPEAAARGLDEAVARAASRKQAAGAGSPQVAPTV